MFNLKLDYKIDYPASGDWMFTQKFIKVMREKLAGYNYLCIFIRRLWRKNKCLNQLK